MKPFFIALVLAAALPYSAHSTDCRYVVAYETGNAERPVEITNFESAEEWLEGHAAPNGRWCVLQSDLLKKEFYKYPVFRPAWCITHMGLEADMVKARNIQRMRIVYLATEVVEVLDWALFKAWAAQDDHQIANLRELRSELLFTAETFDLERFENIEQLDSNGWPLMLQQLLVNLKDCNTIAYFFDEYRSNPEFYPPPAHSRAAVAQEALRLWEKLGAAGMEAVCTGQR